MDNKHLKSYFVSATIIQVLLPIFCWWHAQVLLDKLAEEGQVGKVEFVADFLDVFHVLPDELVEIQWAVDGSLCKGRTHEGCDEHEVESTYSWTDRHLRCESDISPSYHALSGINVCHTIYIQEVPACKLCRSGLWSYSAITPSYSFVNL